MRFRLFLCVCAEILLMFLPGCQNRTQEAPSVPIPLKPSFSSNAKIRCGNLEIKSIFSKEENGRFLLEFQSPEVLQGMSMQYTSDQITIEYRGLTGNYPPDGVSQKAIGKILIDAISSFCQGGTLEMRSNGTQLEARGKLQESGNDFLLILEESSGKLLSLQVPDADLMVSFSEILSS